MPKTFYLPVQMARRSVVALCWLILFAPAGAQVPTRELHLKLNDAVRLALKQGIDVKGATLKESISLYSDATRLRLQQRTESFTAKERVR